MVILLLVGIPILLIVVGYLVWNSAMDNYGYNVFNTGVLVRLLIAVVCCFIDLTFGVILFSLFSIYNFIVTWRNTSFFIALIAVIFQPVALYFTYAALNRLFKAVND